MGHKAKTSASDNNINRLGCIWEASHVQSVTHMMKIHSYARIQFKIISAIHGKVRTEILPLRHAQLYGNVILNPTFCQSACIIYRNSPTKKSFFFFCSMNCVNSASICLFASGDAIKSICTGVKLIIKTDYCARVITF